MSIPLPIGPRLQTVAAFVPANARLGDIGTDHAYLPIALCETRQIAKAVAIDVHAGPYQSALNAVKAHRLEAVIDVRLGDGLKPLAPGEVDVLTLAGMGGRTMLDILSARPDVLESVQDLILQPQGAEEAVRLTLLDNGWRLKAEKLVREDNRIYVVMAYSKYAGWNKAELQTLENRWMQRLHPILEDGNHLTAEFPNLVGKLVWHFGPLVLEERTDLLKCYINDYKSVLARKIEQMKKSNNPEIIAKVKQVSIELAVAEGLQIWQ